MSNIKKWNEQYQKNRVLKTGFVNLSKKYWVQKRKHYTHDSFLLFPKKSS
jgi:hypothetical protein